METKETLWTEENLTAFKYALQGSIGKTTPCSVSHFNHPERGNTRYKNILGVQIESNLGNQHFELWMSQAGVICWDYFQQGNVMNSFSFGG